MTMSNSIQFCSSNRAHALGQHRAYVMGVLERLFPAFDNIESEAEAYANEEYQRLCQRPGWEDGPDLAELAESAQDAGVSLFVDLIFVKGELAAYATAGLYHLWGKTLNSFLRRELENYCLTRNSDLEHADFSSLKRYLADLGFDISAHSFAELLDLCRLIANTVKHGEGTSSRMLAERAPGLFTGPYGTTLPVGNLRPEDLWITTEKFSDFAKAIEDFWNEMPNLLHIPESWIQRSDG